MQRTLLTGGGPEPANFGFLPFLGSSTGLSQNETGFTLSPFGVSLGLTVDDVNGNFSHNFFTATGGLTPVDFDADGRIISLAFRGTITPAGAVPEPATWTLFALGLGGLAVLARRRVRRA
ncbi:MAG: PEP-CTERM sorting domain-containing protein [Candidatus Tectomicrobia bacterium]|uniref:PEP-CTERM sorting domain-containing protein n=1 Tax=Tectimicrobiota bacterium TaxID=2528274 RepID=A0A938B2V2_UNCTE|nr:PEP-CTERM sorting domain-containing protein [Candidatus Tectomicrobia bacterium]